MEIIEIDQKRLIALRKMLNISQKYLASTMEISTGHLSQIERGNKQPCKNSINSIIESYGIKREWIENGVLPVFEDDIQNERVTNTIDIVINIKNMLGKRSLLWLATEMGITYHALRGMLSTRKIPDERLQKMCEIFEVPREYFFLPLNQQFTNINKMEKQQLIQIGKNSNQVTSFIGVGYQGKMSGNKDYTDGENNKLYDNIISVLKEQLIASNLLNKKQEKQIEELQKEVRELYKMLLKQA